jgi:hypothetical protein
MQVRSGIVLLLLVCFSFSTLIARIHAQSSPSEVQILGLKRLTNSALSGTVPVSFKLTNDIGISGCAVLQIDGEKFPGEGGVLSAPLTKNPRFEMDTCYLENGLHALRIHAYYVNPTNDMSATYKSPQISVLVSNEIYYPNWEPEIGELGFSAYFFKTVHTNVDWHLDIYDVRNRFVQRLSGHTTNGTIEAYWHMQDAKGVMRTNIDLDPEFTSTITIDKPDKIPKGLKKSGKK